MAADHSDDEDLPVAQARGLKRAFLYANTIRFLKPQQAAWYVVRRFGPKRAVVPSARPTALQTIAFAPFLSTAGQFALPRSFTFLNATHAFESKIDWQAPDLPRLWLYNLHYFDWATDPAIPVETIQDHILDWIAANPQGTAGAWEPYPLSLRAVNWIKFLLPGSVPRAPEIQESLLLQLRWLAGNCEHHIGANHLLKNAKALFIGGLVFDGDEAASWRTKGLRLLLKQIDEQVLRDGGHYERSFMYHAIVAEDVLDAANFALLNPGLVDPHSAAKLRSTGERMTECLLACLHPDGEIPFFNDAALGIAPRPSALAEYCERLVGHPVGSESSGVELINRRASGYFGYRAPGETLIVDCGEVGPAHQPGHAHCDTLSFELAFGGRRVVVNSGTYDYEPTGLRHHLRSTAAHNTVRIDQAEQSEVWSTFRVARRARPISAAIALRDGAVHFEGAHDGYRRLRGQPTHRRIIDAVPGKSWRVTDWIEGRGQHQIESFVRFHPGIQLSSEGGRWILKAEGKPIANVSIEGASARQQSTIYCPQFGIRQKTQGLVMSKTADLPTQLAFVIERF